MLWILASLTFTWLAFRELRASMTPRRGYAVTRPAYKPYLFLCLTLALLFAWPPVKYWRFERMLSNKASELADNRPAEAHCNTITDTMLDNQQLAAGHANFDTGKIVFQYGWCARLMDYLDDPQHASREDFFALHMLTHESMHVRGERDEAKTECQAVQRNYRAAKMLGVADDLARKHALDFYLHSYLSRRDQGQMSLQYFSVQCAPGKALDEALNDSTWIPLYEAGDY